MTYFNFKLLQLPDLHTKVRSVTQSRFSQSLLYIATAGVCCQLMRTITSEICALWNLSEVKFTDAASTPVPLDINNLNESMFTHSWRPWEHIYALGKQTGKTTINQPQYNVYGKYIVRLFFLVRLMVLCVLL